MRPNAESTFGIQACTSFVTNVLPAPLAARFPASLSSPETLETLIDKGRFAATLERLDAAVEHRHVQGQLADARAIAIGDRLAVLVSRRRDDQGAGWDHRAMHGYGFRQTARGATLQLQEDVLFKTDMNGGVSRVWIITDQEAAAYARK